MIPAFTASDALLIVDVQRDFCSGGALAVRGGEQVVPVLNRWIDAARDGHATVVASRDWHPPDHLSFTARGGPWPVHCVQDTDGAAFHPDLRLPGDTWIVSKAVDAETEAYSAFDASDLADRLRDAGVHRLWIGGLTLDYCVRATVLDALQAGFAVHLIRAATRAVNVNPGDGHAALTEMQDAGAFIEEGA